MGTPIELLRPAITTDAEGFQTVSYTPIAKVRCYMEYRNATEKWANRAAFSNAGLLLRFRHIPGLDVTTDLCVRTPKHIYSISAAENVRSRGMYWEVLCDTTEGTVR
jgi:head-tail adaptor